MTSIKLWGEHNLDAKPEGGGEAAMLMLEDTFVMINAISLPSGL